MTDIRRSPFVKTFDAGAWWSASAMTAIWAYKKLLPAFPAPEWGRYGVRAGNGILRFHDRKRVKDCAYAINKRTGR